MMYSVLYVDDESALLEIVKVSIERTREFQVSTASSAQEALERLASVHYDAIISDYQMPGMDGIAFLKVLRSRGDQTPFIIFTGKGREEVVIEALNSGADFYLQKGGDPKAQFAELVHKIKRSIQDRVSRNLMLEIVQGSPIPQFVIDSGHKVAFWNRALEEYSGIMAGDVIGTKDHWRAFYDRERPCLADLIVENDIDAIVRWYAGKYQESPIVNGAYQATDFFPGIKGGTWLFFTAAPLHDTNGSIIGAVETLQDITSLRTKEDELRVACERAQAALECARESEQKYRTLVEHANEGIFVAQDNYLKFVNPKMSDISGYSSSELLSRPFTDFIHDADREMIISRYRKRVSGEDLPPVYEFRIRSKPGSIRWVEIRPVLIIWEGRPATLNFLTDVTDRKEMEDALKKREEQLNNFMHNLPVGIFRNTPGPHGRRIMANPILAKMHGYDSFEEFMNTPVSDMYADPSERREISTRLQHDGRLSNVALHLKKKNGELFWGRLSAVAVPGDDGTIEYFDGILEDITDQMRTKEAISESENRYRLLLQNANDAIFVYEMTAGEPGKYIEVNERASRLTGYSREELLQMTPSDLDTRRERERADSLVRDTSVPGQEVYPTEIITKGGQKIPVEISATTFDLEGTPTVLTFVRDVTERKRAESALSEAAKKLALLSSITRHDILNKITVLQGYHDLLSRCEQSGEVHELLQKEAAIIDAIIGQIEFTREYEKLGVTAPQWQRVHEVSAYAVRQCDLGHIQYTDETGDLEVYADAMLERVFYNLTENTLRFGEKATRIRISADETKETLVIVFEDDGIGIPESEKERIFQRGYGRHSGFGLFFVREILAITGMTIRETGTPGVGARFEICVPAGGFRYPSSHV
ncbi:MAG: sensory histidine kinase AtoS [Methanoregulaceae archaeon PtaU1.Bin059]|nr:MAG: sensory histidine kinase AtoS [Methanoregulaceae archaeon PtaB.Bin152]OPY40280.1 MAG: sensory histidine kinase AtoS [Methanoregulaceae archaeon PtaU1.Bin059]